MVAIGRVVEVQGGRVVRATGRKDRHSKVYTAKGPRDRRVRLSAVTAIQFYDVQDRLGYDRPSEAVDWLIQKAKASIEALPQKPDGKIGSCFEQNLLQEVGNGVENATGSGLKEEFLEAGNEGSQEKIQDIQHLGVDSINMPSCCSMESLSLLSTDYIHIENSMPEFSYEFGNMLQEESLFSLPPSSRTDSHSMPSSWLDHVGFNPCQFQKNVSLNHKFSSRTGYHTQVCSLSKLFQSRDLSSALSSSMDAQILRVESAHEPACHFPAILEAGLPCQDHTKHYIPMQFQTSKGGVNAGTT